MNKSFKIEILIVLLICITPQLSVKAQEKLTGYQIMERVDKRPIPIDQTAEMTMNLIDKRGKIRSRMVKTYRMGDEKQIM